MTTVAPPRDPVLREITEDGRLILHPHAGQYRAWESKARFVFMFGGPQSGKTAFGPHWLHREIQQAYDALSEQERLKGVGDFMAVTSTYDLFKLKMLPEIKEVFENILGIGRYWAGERLIELREGLSPTGAFRAKKQDDDMYGRIILRSAEAPSGLEAATAKAAWLDEIGQPEFSLDAWEAVLRRLSLYQGRVLGTTTLYNLGWMKNEVFDRWQAGDTNYEVIQFDSTQNPNFPLEEYERARDSMPTWKFNMMYRGLYTRPAGMVYDCFDDTQNVIPRIGIPEDWLWYVGHDFGSANPAALFYAQDPHTGLIYLVHEYLRGSFENETLSQTKSTADQVEDFKRITFGRIVVRRAGGSHQEQDSRENYTSHGWPIAEPTITSVDTGIARVYAFHKRNGIMVFKDCTRYLDEKSTYSYKLGSGYEVLDDIADKSRYHLMDCERYILCGLHADGLHLSGPTQRRRGRW